MYRTIIALLLAIWAGSFCQAQTGEPEGIRFEQTSWEEAIQKARLSGKPLFVDVYASWCGPCKRLAREVFTQRQVGDFFNTHFVNYKLLTDPADTLAQKQAHTIADRYNVRAYPTLLWIDGNGELLHYSIGYLTAEALLEAASKASDTENNTAALLRRWEEGDRSLTVGMNYFEVNSDSLAQFDDFYLSLPIEDKLNEELMYRMMFSIPLTARSRALQYIANNFENVYRADSNAGSWELMLKNALENSFRKTGSEAERDTIAQWYASLPYTAECRDIARCEQLGDAGDYAGFFEHLEKMCQTYSDYSFLHQLCFYAGTALSEGKLKDLKPQPILIDRIEQYIRQGEVSDLWAAYYRITGWALLGNSEKTAFYHQVLTNTLQNSDEIDAYKESINDYANALLQKVQAKQIQH